MSTLIGIGTRGKDVFSAPICPQPKPSLHHKHFDKQLGRVLRGISVSLILWVLQIVLPNLLLIVLVLPQIFAV